MHQQAIENMANALLPGGKLVLDYMNAQKIAAKLVPKDQIKLISRPTKSHVEDQTIVKPSLSETAALFSTTKNAFAPFKSRACEFMEKVKCKKCTRRL